MTRAERVAWVIGLAATAVLPGGVALAAKGKPTIEATPLAVDNLQSGAEIASCGRGERALGGGVVQSGSPSGLSLPASGPLDSSGFVGATEDGDAPKRWYGATVNASGVDDRAFKVLAICDPDSQATIEATRFTTNYREDTEKVAECGPGERALGGGVVQIGSPDYTLIRESEPLDSSGSTANTRDGDTPKQWRATVYQADDDGRVFKVFAICAPHSDATIEATVFTVGDDQSGQARAKCGRGERALAGGIAPKHPTQGFSQPYVEASGPLDASGLASNTRDGDVAKQWYGAVSNSLGDGERAFKVFVICSRA